MKETMEVGPAPHGEDCAQLGTPNYEERARSECQAFIRQLTRAYHKEHGDALPHGFRFVVKSNSHDFGVYFEVAMTFNDDNVGAMKAAEWFEDNIPELWDDEAKQELESIK